MTPCPACHRPFASGDLQALVVLGPADDPEEQQKAREGRPYNAVAVAVHWTCAGGDADEGARVFASMFPNWKATP